MFINKKDGTAAQLLSQDEKSVVTFAKEGGEPQAAPSHQFFTDYREATDEERAAVKVAPKSEAE